MGAVAAVAGVALVVATVIDTVLTVVRVETRGGPITSGLSSALWRLFAGPRMTERGGPPAATGVVIALTVVTAWLLMTLIGWFLIFSADPGAIIEQNTGEPADGWARLYFTAYTVSTLGIGDYVPASALWRVLTGLAATAGFALATLIITQLASLTAAVTAKRQLARTIWGLGDTPEHVVQTAWNGQRFEALDQQLMSLTPQLNAIAEQHLAFPVLYYFRTSDRRTADWPAIAMLHEVLVIMSEVVHPDVQLPELITRQAHAAIDGYLESLPTAPAERHEDLRIEHIHAMEVTGIPLRDHAHAGPHPATAQRRHRLVAVLQHQGWTWDQAVRAQPRIARWE